MDRPDCHLKSVGTNCEWECDAGYAESDQNGVICAKKDANTARWQPTPKCEPQACGAADYPHIPVESDNIVAYVTYFDKDRKLPIWSFAIHDSKNMLRKVARGGDFYTHPCPLLNRKQGQNSDYSLTGWDRGHLSPSASHRYSKKATRSSNLLINVAPQDPWINQVPWRGVEGHVLCHNRKYAASLVATGVCPDSIGKTKAGGLDVPACFWKMICYMRNGQTHVVGFLAENQHISPTDVKQKNETKHKIFTPVSQAVIRNRLRSNPTYLESPFAQFVYTKAIKGSVEKDRYKII